MDYAGPLDYDMALKGIAGGFAMSLRGKTAIAGLGITKMGKNYAHPNAIGFATEALELALADAGLRRSDLDGVLVNPGLTWGSDGYLYGTTMAGGAHQGGKIFRITPSGHFTTLYDFCALPACAAWP